MILTGKRIRKQQQKGNISISPFDERQLNPNSYNYRLGTKLCIPQYSKTKTAGFTEIQIPEEGYVLKPGVVYLSHTFEILGSSRYAMSLIGTSSIGRLGLFVQISANLGHTGSSHQWTLELMCAQKFKIYPLMRIGQISFWENKGKSNKYVDGYSNHNDPTPSRLMKGRVRKARRSGDPVPP